MGKAKDDQLVHHHPVIFKIDRFISFSPLERLVDMREEEMGHGEGENSF
jgi:hypothetical protein